MSAGLFEDAGENLAHMRSHVKMEEEGKYAGISEQHSDVFERNQVQMKLEDNLLFESKISNKQQKRDIVEGDIFKDIQEVWVAEIYIEIFGIAFEACLGEKEEIEARRAEENNQ